MVQVPHPMRATIDPIGLIEGKRRFDDVLYKVEGSNNAFS